MKPFALPLLLLVVACGSPAGFEATLSDHSDTVTDAAEDNLFSLALGQVPDPIPIVDVDLWLAPPGGTTNLIQFLHTDADGDGALSTGDTLTGVEPVANIVGLAEIGSDFEVTLVEDLGESRVSTLWEGVWTAQ